MRQKWGRNCFYPGEKWATNGDATLFFLFMMYNSHMARPPRSAPGGLVFNVQNRTVGRMAMFRKPADYDAFLRVLLLAHQRHPIRILAFCLMPTHWHFVVWPDKDNQLIDFFRW